MFIPESEQAEFQAACAAMIGWLDRLANEAHRQVMSDWRNRRWPVYGKDATRLSLAVSDFYAATFREIDADDDELSLELGEISAEDFGHIPPKNQS